MRLLGFFLFALGVLTGTGGPSLAPQPDTTTAPATPVPPPASPPPAAAPDQATGPRCPAGRQPAAPVAAPERPAENLPAPRPAGG